MSGSSWWLTGRVNDPFNLIRQAEAAERVRARRAGLAAAAPAVAIPKTAAAVPHPIHVPTVVRYSLHFGDFAFNEREKELVDLCGEFDREIYGKIRGKTQDRIAHEDPHLSDMFLVPGEVVRAFVKSDVLFGAIRSRYEGWCTQEKLSRLARSLNDTIHGDIELISKPLDVKYSPVYSILDDDSDTRATLHMVNYLLTARLEPEQGVNPFILLVALWLRYATFDPEMGDPDASIAARARELDKIPLIRGRDDDLSTIDADLLILGASEQELAEIEAVRKTKKTKADTMLNELKIRLFSKVSSPEYIAQLGEKFSRRNWFGVKINFSTIPLGSVEKSSLVAFETLKARVLASKQVEPSAGSFFELVDPSWRLDPKLTHVFPNVPPCILPFSDNSISATSTSFITERTSSNGRTVDTQDETEQFDPKQPERPSTWSPNEITGTIDAIKYLDPNLRWEAKQLFGDPNYSSNAKLEFLKIFQVLQETAEVVEIIVEYCNEPTEPLYYTGSIAELLEAQADLKREMKSEKRPGMILIGRMYLAVYSHLPTVGLRATKGETNMMLEPQIATKMAHLKLITGLKSGNSTQPLEGQQTMWSSWRDASSLSSSGFTTSPFTNSAAADDTPSSSSSSGGLSSTAPPAANMKLRLESAYRKLDDSRGKIEELRFRCNAEVDTFGRQHSEINDPTKKAGVAEKMSRAYGLSVMLGTLLGEIPALTTRLVTHIKDLAGVTIKDIPDTLISCLNVIIGGSLCEVYTWVAEHEDAKMPNHKLPYLVEIPNSPALQICRGIRMELIHLATLSPLDSAALTGKFSDLTQSIKSDIALFSNLSIS